MAAVEPPMPLLYEDDALVIVDKPAGVAVVPAPGVSACVQHRVAEAIGGRLWAVHRLDLDTSGALAFARTAAAHRALSMAFEHRDVAKVYVAAVAGVPEPPNGTIDLALHDARKGRMRPATPGEPGALEARTDYVVDRIWPRGPIAAARVTARPLTGRHHQIRVHLRAIGTPILNDAHYGRRALLPAGAPCRRLALHALHLNLPHPEGDRRVQVTAPVAADLEALFAWLDAAEEVAS